jgi:cold shock CspA family protein
MRRMRGQTKQHDVKLQAKVIKLFPEMDYGFLETPDGREIYFNRDSVLDTHFNRLRIGSAVHFAGEVGEKGPRATTVKLVHPAKQARSAAKSKVVKAPQPPRRKRVLQGLATGRK